MKVCAWFKNFGIAPIGHEELKGLVAQVQIGQVTRFEGRIIAVYEKYSAQTSKLRKHVAAELSRSSKGDNPVDLATTHIAMRKFVEETMAGSQPEAGKRPSHSDTVGKHKGAKRSRDS